jgi:SPP1 gp7 family putative phage head morphogenesis protein
MPETNNINLQYLFSLAPENGVKYLDSKGYEISFDWRDVWRDAHNKSFTIAKAMNVDILRDIKDSCLKSLTDGITFKQFQRDLTPTLITKGWWGKKEMTDPKTGQAKEVQLGSPRRLLTIYETNMNVAYSVGRYKELILNVDNRPYWQYKGIMDDNIRPEHAALNNKVYRYDHPFWQIYYPPNDWGCRCYVIALSSSDLVKLGLKAENALPPEKELPPQEWAYNPGATNYGVDVSFWNKVEGLKDAKLKSDIISNVVNSDEWQQGFEDWVDSVLAREKPLTGDTKTVGFLDDDVYNFLKEKGIVPNTGVIVFSDKQLIHADRGIHKTRGTALSTEDYKNLPKLVNNPEAVLFQEANSNILYVYSLGNEKAKFVATVNYKLKQKGIVNYIDTALRVPALNLQDKAKYKLIKGKI